MKHDGRSEKTRKSSEGSKVHIVFVEQEPFCRKEISKYFFSQDSWDKGVGGVLLEAFPEFHIIIVNGFNKCAKLIAGNPSLFSMELVKISGGFLRKTGKTKAKEDMI
ncbi:hypothetical protein [Enterococcus diestrammenae]|uniref:hypothetical protein n=1 Tax=Enterococcus diestrammenae TaxID=1155073 RepID=UPI0022E02807|nr:hypothetical protein [Enterococcus diestrammenae]